LAPESFWAVGCFGGNGEFVQAFCIRIFCNVGCCGGFWERRGRGFVDLILGEVNGGIFYGKKKKEKGLEGYRK